MWPCDGHSSSLRWCPSFLERQIFRVRPEKKKKTTETEPLKTVTDPLATCVFMCAIIFFKMHTVHLTGNKKKTNVNTNVTLSTLQHPLNRLRHAELPQRSNAETSRWNAASSAAEPCLDLNKPLMSISTSRAC